MSAKTDETFFGEWEFMKKVFDDLPFFIAGAKSAFPTRLTETILTKAGFIMCGIVGYVGKNNAKNFLIKGLEKLEYRGYDSAGIATINGGVLYIEKTTERIASLKNTVEAKNSCNGNIGIGHTRWATHGAPSIKNAHPHTDNFLEFAVVHNGIIENYAEIKKVLENEGVIFESETDTEVIAHLLKKHYKGDILKAISDTTKLLRGSYALGIINKNEENTLYATKHFSPLIIGLNKEENYIASDVTAILEKTKNAVYLKDGEIAKLSFGGVEFYDDNLKKIKKEISVINWEIAEAEKGGFDHFMLKEIYEQPRAILNTITPRIKNNEINFEKLNLTKSQIKNINRIVITACGSAYHAGIVAKYFYEEILRIPTEVELASEFRYKNPIINKNTLVIIISQSGETADTLAALKQAKEKGAHVLSIVNVISSSIAKESHDVLYTFAGPEIAVATTKGYTTQLTMLYLFGIYTAKILKSYDTQKLNLLIKNLLEIPKSIEEVLENSQKIKELACRFSNNDSVFFIGRNMDYAVALEGSLKLKEISYVHSEAYAAGELKHGTISLIEKDRLVIALCCYNELLDKQLSNVKEVLSRGATVFATAFSENEQIKSYASEVFYLPKTHPLLLALLEVVPLQLFAYFVALNKNLDIDKPRNLAKSVTVE